MIQLRAMKTRLRVDLDRLSIFLGVVALGFTLGRLVELPTRYVGLDVLGSPLGIDLSASWLVTAFVAALVVTGSHMLFLDHPHYSAVRGMPVFWILPGLIAIATGAFLANTAGLSGWLAAMITGLVLLAITIANEYRALDPAELGQPGVQLLATVITYAVGLGLLILIHAMHARALLLVPVAFGATALLATRFLWNGLQEFKRVLLYGGLIGLVMAQAVWAVSYWQIGSLMGGCLLLLIFYVTAGIAQQALLGQMGRQVLVEYGVVTLIAAVVIVALL